MRLMKTGQVVATLVALFGLIGIAGAQTDTAAPAPVEVGAQQDVSLTPQQMLGEAERYVPAMDQGGSTVRRQLSKAREDKDVVKVLCLNDKLTQIDVAVRSAQDRLSSLRAAVTRSDADRSKHEFTILQVLRDRVRTLVTEANQCIGEEFDSLGESQVTVEIDPNIPDTDPSVIPSEPIIAQPPLVSSPVR
jgi:hypothetical protein